MRPPKRRQKTTSIQCYSVLQSNTTYYKTTIQYYSVLQSTTKYYSDLRTKSISTILRTTYYKTTFQYYSVLQSTTEASKTSTFQATSFPNEHFVRGFLHFSGKKRRKRAFRARLPQLFKQQASQTSISCEASSTFQVRSVENEHFVRVFLNFSSKKLSK